MNIRIGLTGLMMTVCLVASASLAQADETWTLEEGRAYIHPSRTARIPGASMDANAIPTFHNGTTLLCSQCHTIHASARHPHDGQTLPDPFGGFPQQFTPTEKLLKGPDPIAVCLTCHDNMAGIPDVVGADVNGLTDRSAGQFDPPNQDNPRGHKLEYGLDTSPGFGLCMRCHFGGSFATAAVSCIDCHNPHGNNRPRNLQWASDPGGEPPLGLFENPGAGGLAGYESENVSYGTLDDNTLREVSSICIDCHHVFTGDYYIDPESDGIHNRHPSYDSERGSTNHISQGQADGTTDPVHWVDGTGAGFVVTPRLRFVQYGATDFSSALTIDEDQNGVFCLSCHKAHGGLNAFGLLWDPASGINAEGCDQCHNKTAM